MVHLLRGIAALMGVHSAGGVFTPSPAQVGFGLLFALSPIALAMIVQMMLHARISGSCTAAPRPTSSSGCTRGGTSSNSRERLRGRRAAGAVHHPLMIDLDHSSRSTTFGHSVGDCALRHAARVKKALKNLACSAATAGRSSAH